MTKILVAVIIALGALTANASGVCNPDQQDCGPVGPSHGGPAWLQNIGAYMASLPGYKGNVKAVCNPDQDVCIVAREYPNLNNSTLLKQMNAFAAAHGWMATPTFNNNTGN